MLELVLINKAKAKTRTNKLSFFFFCGMLMQGLAKSSVVVGACETNKTSVWWLWARAGWCNSLELGLSYLGWFFCSGGGSFWHWHERPWLNKWSHVYLYCCISACDSWPVWISNSHSAATQHPLPVCWLKMASSATSQLAGNSYQSAVNMTHAILSLPGICKIWDKSCISLQRPNIIWLGLLQQITIGVIYFDVNFIWGLWRLS